jgi:hypothetical protein
MSQLRPELKNPVGFGGRSLGRDLEQEDYARWMEVCAWVTRYTRLRRVRRHCWNRLLLIESDWSAYGGGWMDGWLGGCCFRSRKTCLCAALLKSEMSVLLCTASAVLQERELEVQRTAPSQEKQKAPQQEQQQQAGQGDHHGAAAAAAESGSVGAAPLGAASADQNASAAWPFGCIQSIQCQEAFYIVIRELKSQVR